MNKSQPKSLKTVFSGSWHFLLAPSNSSVQVHDNESRPVIVHVPLFLHGCDLQGLTKEMKHYDWQRKRCLKRPFLSCLYLVHNFVQHIRRHIHSCKSHLQLQCRLPHFGKGCLMCTGSLRLITKLFIWRPRFFIF